MVGFCQFYKKKLGKCSFKKAVYSFEKGIQSWQHAKFQHAKSRGYSVLAGVHCLATGQLMSAL